MTIFKSMSMAMAMTLCAVPLCSEAGGDQLLQVKMSVDENPIVPHLAQALGYLEDEGIEIVTVNIKDFGPNDYQFQSLLAEGKIDIAYHWFNHAIFGARNNKPVVAVMMINDAPAMEVLVSAQRRGEIRSAQDFSSINIAEGSLYGTKSVITGYLAQKAGLPPGSYTSVIKEVAGRQEAVAEGLSSGKVDVVTAQEPMVSALKDAGLALPLYDMSSGAATRELFGAQWPAQSLLVAPAAIKSNPKAIQGVVNAYVRTLRYMASNDVDAIVASLPEEYFAGKDRDAEIAFIRATLPSYAKHDYQVELAGVRLVDEVLGSSAFDDSPAGKWRAAGRDVNIDLGRLYDNRFVARAQALYPAAINGSKGK